MRAAPEALNLPETGDTGSGKPGVERRACPRVPCRLGVRFRSTLALAEAVHATTRDIGGGGLCLRTQRTYEPGTPLDVTIDLGAGGSLTISAEVAWSRPGQAIGVRFVAVSDAQRDELSRVLQRATVEAQEALQAAADAAPSVRD